VSAVRIRYFTDPACPPDPARMRLRRQYGDQIAWELRMIVVREQRGSGWPQERGSDATIHACRAVVATGLRWPDRQEAMLRRLQALAQAGELLDDSDTLEIAAEQAGLPVAELAAYCAEPEVEAALRADMEAAAGRTCGTLELVSGEWDDLVPRCEPPGDWSL
jgi:predicted DsbA family dithiol-disulfide isomerase